MDWLATHVSAVEAFASVASLIVASVLAYLTLRYVKLTRRLTEDNTRMAELNLEQYRLNQQLLFEAKQRKAVMLKELSRRIRVPLKRLAPENPDPKIMREYAYLRDGDISELRILAGESDINIIKIANEIVLALRMVVETLDRAQDINGKNFEFSPQQREDWRGSIELLKEKLPQLEGYCDEVLREKSRILSLPDFQSS